jgi:hypothetical protein
MSYANVPVSHVQGGRYLILNVDANGLPCVIAAGQGNSDGTIVSDLGADTNFADGSLYLSCVDGAGTMWIKAADTWTQIT